MSRRKHVVVVGGGFGGLTVAKALRKADVEVTLVDRENHHLFQPLLYQVATAGLNPAQIAVPIRSVLGRQANTQVVLDEAREVSLEAKTLSLKSGRVLHYDYLVAATGAKTNYFGHDDWARFAGGLKSLRDALRFRERVLLAFEAAEVERDADLRRELLTFVVIGGGPTGVEMAGAISELGRHVLADDFKTIKPEDVRVILVEMADRVLLPFDPQLSEKAKLQLEQIGVEVRLGAGVKAIDERGVIVGDELIRAAVVCWATGVKPASFAQHLGVPLHPSGRVLVDGHCAVPEHPDVFAVGDMAQFVPEGESRPLPGVAQVAMQQGEHVATCIRRDLASQPRGEAFRYFDKGSMATVGRSRAVLESGKIKMAGFFAWLAWSLVHVMYLIGFHNRFMVLMTWVWSYLTWKRGARLITTHISKRPDPIRRGERASLPEDGRTSLAPHASPIMTASDTSAGAAPAGRATVASGG